MHELMVRALIALWWAGLLLIDGYITKRLFTPMMTSYAGTWLFYVAGTFMCIFFVGFGLMLRRLPHDLAMVFGKKPLDQPDENSGTDARDEDTK